MADEADRSVFLVLLQVAFLGKCDDQGLGPRDWPFSYLPNLAADSVRLQLTSLSSMTVLQPLLFFCEGWSGRPLCVSGNSSVLIDPRWPCDCTAQSGILSISSDLLFFCEAFY